MLKSFLKYFIVVLMTSMICVIVFSTKMFHMRGILDNSLKKPVGSALKSITDDMEHGRFEVAKSKLGILSSEWNAFSQGNCLDRTPGSIMAKFSALDNAITPNP